jgi:heat-inducible transcriptional repressor
MLKGLTARREAVLKIIVSEYIDTAVPVASETIFRNYKLGVSPATIRNDMAYLEEEGYIARPHTSAGSVTSGNKIEFENFSTRWKKNLRNG